MGIDPTKRPPLLPYQTAGVDYLLSRTSAILADDMGLGKTAQAAVALATLFSTLTIQRVLVACPLAVCEHWRRELERWTGISAVMYRGADRYGLLTGQARAIITSHDTLVRDLTPVSEEGTRYVDIGIDLFVLDEAQKIKELSSLRSRVLSSVLAPRRWALTGTPLENHPTEFAAVLRWLLPNEFRSDDSSQATERLFAFRDRFMLRRTKAGVGLQLPSKTVAHIPVSLTPTQSAEYNQQLERLRSQDTSGARGSRVLAHLQLLRRIATIASSGESSKLDLLDDEVREIVANGHKVVIFSSFAKLVLPKVHALFRNLGAEFFTGDMSREAREAADRRFMSDPGCKVMCASLGAAGTGLTWTTASYVYHLDLWWNPQVMNQADDRVHRIGQTQPVLVRRLYSAGTIEEAMLKLLEAKRSIFELMISGNDASGQPISTPAEILESVTLRSRP